MHVLLTNKEREVHEHFMIWATTKAQKLNIEFNGILTSRFITVFQCPSHVWLLFP
jgi:hypothetical protein